MARLKAASTRIDAAREGADSAENTRAWLLALTDYARALGEIQEFTSESLTEQMVELSRKARVSPLVGDDFAEGGARASEVSADIEP